MACALVINLPDNFLSGVHNNMDENDTVEKISAVIDKHLA